MTTQLAEHNKNHFNKTAGQYDQRPDVLEATRRIAKAVKEAYSFDKENTSVLDYACGTGLLSAHMAPHVKSITGVDISEGALDIYNKRMKEMKLDTSNFHAIVSSDIKSDLSDIMFDVIICSMAYHHFDSIAKTTETLVSFLKPHGALFVIDLCHYHPTPSSDLEKELEQRRDMINTHHKHGFTEQEIRDTLTDAGLHEFQFTRFTTSYRSGTAWFLFPDSEIPPELDEQGNPKGDKIDFFLAKAEK